MIMVLDETYQKLAMVSTEEELFLYLQEKLRTLEELERQNWQFTRYSHKLLAKFAEEMREESRTYMEWQACRQEQDMMFICMGDANNPSLRLVTPDLNIRALRNEWCQRYCKAHNMYLVTQ